MKGITKFHDIISRYYIVNITVVKNDLGRNDKKRM